MKTLILGLGNELYGDDGVGIHVVRQIKQKIEANSASSKVTSQIDCQECSLSGIALIDVIVGYDSLIIIDTIKSTNPKPGKIRLLDENQLRHIPGPSPHYVSVPQTIEIGRELGLKVPSRIKVIAVEAKRMYNLGEGLTQDMKNAIPRIVQEVQTLLEKLEET